VIYVFSQGDAPGALTLLPDDQGGARLARLGKTALHVVHHRRPDGAADVEHQRFLGPGGGSEPEREQEQHDADASQTVHVDHGTGRYSATGRAAWFLQGGAGMGDPQQSIDGFSARPVVAAPGVGILYGPPRWPGSALVETKA